MCMYIPAYILVGALLLWFRAILAVRLNLATVHFATMHFSRTLLLWFILAVRAEHCACPS